MTKIVMQEYIKSSYPYATRTGGKRKVMPTAMAEDIHFLHIKTVTVEESILVRQWARVYSGLPSLLIEDFLIISFNFDTNFGNVGHNYLHLLFGLYQSLQSSAVKILL